MVTSDLVSRAGEIAYDDYTSLTAAILFFFSSLFHFILFILFFFFTFTNFIVAREGSLCQRALKHHWKWQAETNYLISWKSVEPCRCLFKLIIKDAAFDCVMDWKQLILLKPPTANYSPAKRKNKRCPGQIESWTFQLDYVKTGGFAFVSSHIENGKYSPFVQSTSISVIELNIKTPMFDPGLINRLCFISAFTREAEKASAIDVSAKISALQLLQCVWTVELHFKLLCNRPWCKVWLKCEWNLNDFQSKKKGKKKNRSHRSNRNRLALESFTWKTDVSTGQSVSILNSKLFQSV